MRFDKYAQRAIIKGVFITSQDEHLIFNKEMGYNNSVLKVMNACIGTGVVISKMNFLIDDPDFMDINANCTIYPDIKYEYMLPVSLLDYNNGVTYMVVHNITDGKESERDVSKIWKE